MTLRAGANTNQMMHAHIDPSDKILLSDILAIKKPMKVDHRGSGEMKIPHRTRRRFRLFPERHGEVISCPVGILQHSSRSDDSLDYKRKSIS